MKITRRGAETGSRFQEAINLANEVYERIGRACITRKAIPGKYLIERNGARPDLTLSSLGLAQGSEQLRLTATALNRLAKDHKLKDWRRFIPESKAEPDYGGTLAPDGRAIFYDAKTTRRELLDFDNLHAHQVIFLDRMARFGAVAGFLVEFSRHGEVYFLPIQALMRWRENPAHTKSLPYRFFVEHLSLAPAGKGLLMFDYLSAVEAQERRYGRDFTRLRL